MSSPTERLSFLPDFPGRESLYHPLDANKDEIRVITVQPSQQRSSAIHCFLQTISIEDDRSTKSYDALSYAWGSTENTDSIFVHNSLSADQPDSGVRVPVTYALTGALRQFRAKATKSSELLVMWTDAVCINQRDAAERSQQVSMMRRVYESAKSVRMWLGDSDPIAEMGLVNLFGVAMCRQANRLNRSRSENFPAAFDYEDFDAEPDLDTLEKVDNILERSACTPHGSEIQCKHIRDMCKHMKSWIQTVSALLNVSYWYRGWTIQEASANSHIFLHYGQTRCLIVQWKTLEWIMFGKTCTLSRIVGEDGAHTFTSFTYWIRATAEAQLCNGFFQDILPPPTDTNHCQSVLSEMAKSDLSTLVSSIGQTADPRDRVYSLIGYMPTFKLLRIEPDYTLTTEQVYIATTVAILLQSQSWSHDQFVRPSGSPFLPSWAIDFTLIQSPEAHRCEGRMPRIANFKADGGASFRLHFLPPGHLHTAGFTYDEIIAIGPQGLLNNQVKRDRWYHMTKVSWEYSKRMVVNNTLRIHVNKTWDEMEGLFLRTLCVGRVGKTKFAPEYAVASGRLFSVKRDVLEETLLLDDDSSSVRLAKGRLLDTQEDALNFIFTKGGHIGAAPHNVKVGDRIAILATGDAPFIIRNVCEQGHRHNGHNAHVLIGSCYIEGETFPSRSKTGDIS
jgi:hypothetical protein